MKNIYLIGGPMGVGKTTVCKFMKKELSNCVFLDGDWCWDADPFIVTQETKTMVQNNIYFLLNQFIHCSAYENIVFCWVMHQQAIIDDIVAALDLQSISCSIHIVSLVCDPDTLIERINQDISHGLRTSDSISRSLDRLACFQNVNSQKVDTTNKTVEMVVNEIIHKD